MSENLLGHESSPYLLQHRDNPVHWRAWDDAAFAEARSADKPILLSIGYAACHWCHVMAHESFEDPGIAALMNDLFVNIKVDREERPDVDAIYQSALALTGQQGGWPLTMFLTPGGEPFWGGTYFPSTPRFGRPGFPDILRRIADVYRSDKDAVGQNTRALVDALGRMAGPAEDAESVPLNDAVRDQIAAHLVSQSDAEHGGIGGAPKFPQSYAYEAIWRSYLRTGDERLRAAVETTLRQMCQGGIYDHLGGGFARYSTDAEWLAPHFEKMLYDNAQIIELLCLVWQHTREPLYELRVRETVDWLAREMIAEGGGFAATLDADSEGVEGKFYVWTAAEIEALLGPRAPAFMQAYDVSPDGNWEGHNILNRRRDPVLKDPDTEAALAADRAVLFEARAPRVRPGWDDKVLADWNGLMIAALAMAGQVFEAPDWVAMAARAFDFVTAEMSDGDGQGGGPVNRLWHSARDGRLRSAGMLDDYAAMSRAALILDEIEGGEARREWALGWLASLDAHFWDAEHGGYFFTADDAENLIARTRHCHDNATPSGNGLMIEVLLRLWLATGDSRFAARADAIVTAFSPELRRNFFPLTGLINRSELAGRAQQVVLLREPGDADGEALRRAAYRVSAPNRLVQVLAPDASLPDRHPAAGKGLVDGRATAYVCIGQACSLPIHEPSALAAALAPALGAA